MADEEAPGVDGMRHADRQANIIGGGKRLLEIARERLGLRQLAEPDFGRDFYSRGGADEDFVVQRSDRVAGRLAELATAGECPDQRMRVEQQLQSPSQAWISS